MLKHEEEDHLFILPMKRVLSVAIFLVRIVDDFVEDVFELAAIVVELIVLKNLCVVFGPFREQILSSF